MLKELNKDELIKKIDVLKNEYEKIKSENLSLDMSRGKPCKEQLDLSMDVLSILNENSNLICKDGTDCRNYGKLGGIEEAREILSTYMENDKDNILIFGNSSLNIMYDMVMYAYVFGIDNNTPWGKLKECKFLCPVPGYDRHFAITEEFGIKMINIKMNNDGPDMDTIEKLVESDESIKGIWCVPKYSNPDGISYSNQVVHRFANLNPKAKDFRIFWDNAYTVHHLYDDPNKQDYILEILRECKNAGKEDMVYKFGSTSKIVFPGSGIAAMAASKKNIDEIKKHLAVQIIGYDKVNELRYAVFFKDLQGIKNQMKKHADILRPKFELVYSKFDEAFSEDNLVRWTKPNGGYFISFYGINGTAKKIVSMCKDAGVTLTAAGSSYPYHKDPDDSNIRIAPSFPSIKDLEKALTVFCLVVNIVNAEKILEKM